jgi:hypothetical protein
MVDDTTSRSKPLRAEDRQAALAYLRTATRTDDAAERNALRRRAAELILPRGDETAEAFLEGEDAQGPGGPRDFS